MFSRFSFFFHFTFLDYVDWFVRYDPFCKFWHFVSMNPDSPAADIAVLP